MEVCGSVGAAQRLARTVILGDDMALVTKLIFVLSYFVRCSALRVNAVAGTYDIVSRVFFFFVDKRRGFT